MLLRRRSPSVIHLGYFAATQLLDLLVRDLILAAGFTPEAAKILCSGATDTKMQVSEITVLLSGGTPVRAIRGGTQLTATPRSQKWGAQDLNAGKQIINPAAH
jgi:hypothetical protein